MADTEKITINMNAVELGKIDLLVEQGHYSNRTDFIRSAIRSQLEKHTFEVQQAATRDSYVIGVLSYGKSDLEACQAKGERLNITIMGMLHLHNDIPASLAAEVIESLQVRGVFQASEAVKAALADRMK